MITAHKVKEFSGDTGLGVPWTRILWDVAGEHIVTLAVPIAFATRQPETLVFEADADGRVVDWADLPGSFRGAMDHERAIQGYCAALNMNA